MRKVIVMSKNQHVNLLLIPLYMPALSARLFGSNYLIMISWLWSYYLQMISLVLWIIGTISSSSIIPFSWASWTRLAHLMNSLQYNVYSSSSSVCLISPLFLEELFVFKFVQPGFNTEICFLNLAWLIQIKYMTLRTALYLCGRFCSLRPLAMWLDLLLYIYTQLAYMFTYLPPWSKRMVVHCFQWYQVLSSENNLTVIAIMQLSMSDSDGAVKHNRFL